MSFALRGYRHNAPFSVVSTSRLRWALSWNHLFAPVDTASLAVVRIVLGCLVTIDAFDSRLFYPSGGVLPFHFKYQFFHWVQESPAFAAYLPFVLFISGIAVTIGFFFRFFSALCLILITYAFLLQAEFYLNHFYMLIILLFLLCVSPANRSFSVDKVLFPARDGIHASRIYLFLFKAQLEIILIYAGLVKINSDWLQLEPLRTWLLDRREMLFFGELLQTDLVIAIGAYGTILLHIVGAPLLLFARTRLAVFIIYCIFHVTNHFTFNIGIFPWMTIACTTLFFPADWPRRVLRLLTLSGGYPKSLSNGGMLAAPRSFGNYAIVVFTGFWILFQAMFPLRHFLYPGWVEWTNEGHRFAWRMKLTSRRSPGVLLAVYVPELSTVHIPNLKRYLSERQYDGVSTAPDLVQQLAWQIANIYKNELGIREVQVFAYAPMTLNNRRPALLINPTVDLAGSQWTLWHDSWLTKYNPNPLRRIEEVDAAELSMKPGIQQVLSNMKLPAPKSCQRPGATMPTLFEEAVCYLE